MRDPRAYVLEPVADHRHAFEDLLVWRRDLGKMHAVLPPHGIEPNPLVVDELVIASTFDPGKIIALDRHTGGGRWSLDLPGSGGPHVVFADGVVYAQTARTLFALDPHDGRTRWRWTPYEVASEVWDHHSVLPVFALRQCSFCLQTSRPEPVS